MNYSVFFREDKEIFSAGDYIAQQLKEHREILLGMVSDLAKNGTISNTIATKTANGDWWVMLKAENGDLHTYSIFVSRFEKDIESEIETKQTTKKELVIIDPNGARDSVGGYHPGYWTVAEFMLLIEERQRPSFLTTIQQIKQNIPSEFYTMNKDGSISIHIHQYAKAYTISLECMAEWK